ncbi:hypothetical protein WDZ92_04425 [Nostoc sp. NIES-2111]
MIATANETRRTIPFDYAVSFPLAGEPGLSHRRTLEVSVEAAFSVTSIGYGFLPDLSVLSFGPEPQAANFNALAGPVAFGASNVTLENLADWADQAVARRPELRAALGGKGLLDGGIRLNPELRGQFRFAPGSIGAASAASAFQAVAFPDAQVPFLYGLFDQGSGRVFQNELILSVAGLGAADGERPFRQYAPPIHFAPRTVIGLEVQEASAWRGTLQIALHGFKTLGEAGTPTDPRRRRRSRR